MAPNGWGYTYAEFVQYFGGSAGERRWRRARPCTFFGDLDRPGCTHVYTDAAVKSGVARGGATPVLRPSAAEIEFSKVAVGAGAAPNRAAAVALPPGIEDMICYAAVGADVDVGATRGGAAVHVSASADAELRNAAVGAAERTPAARRRHQRRRGLFRAGYAAGSADTFTDHNERVFNVNPTSAAGAAACSAAGAAGAEMEPMYTYPIGAAGAAVSAAGAAGAIMKHNVASLTCTLPDSAATGSAAVSAAAWRTVAGIKCPEAAAAAATSALAVAMHAATVASAAAPSTVAASDDAVCHHALAEAVVDAAAHDTRNRADDHSAGPTEKSTIAEAAPADKDAEEERRRSLEDKLVELSRLLDVERLRRGRAEDEVDHLNSSHAAAIAEHCAAAREALTERELLNSELAKALADLELARKASSEGSHAVVIRDRDICDLRIKLADAEDGREDLRGEVELLRQRSEEAQAQLQPFFDEQLRASEQRQAHAEAEVERLTVQHRGTISELSASAHESQTERERLNDELAKALADLGQARIEQVESLSACEARNDEIRELGYELRDAEHGRGALISEVGTLRLRSEMAQVQLQDLQTELEGTMLQARSDLAACEARFVTERRRLDEQLQASERRRALADAEVEHHAANLEDLWSELNMMTWKHEQECRLLVATSANRTCEAEDWYNGACCGLNLELHEQRRELQASVYYGLHLREELTQEMSALTEADAQQAASCDREVHAVWRPRLPPRARGDAPSSSATGSPHVVT